MQHAQPSYDIRYLAHPEIDPDKWDACLARCPNALIYAQSYWLDHLAGEQWDALVLGDYEAIMPLPWRKKWGVRYVYQPPFTQQLGVFSPAALDSYPPIGHFTTEIVRHFRFAEIFLNYANPSGSRRPYRNYILSLEKSYDQIAGRYKRSLTTNLKLAGRFPLQYTKDLDAAKVIALYRKGYAARTPHVTRKDYTNLEALCRSLHEKDRLLVRAVRDEKGEILATALLPRDLRRIYLLQTTSSPEGRQMAAGPFLLDNLVKEWAGHPLLLDFEGSELPGVRFFYSNFGGVDQPYYFYRYNILPWPIRIFKK